jgi:hypothetical protein
VFPSCGLVDRNGSTGSCGASGCRVAHDLLVYCTLIQRLQFNPPGRSLCRCGFPAPHPHYIYELYVQRSSRSISVTNRRGGKRKEKAGKQAGNREAQAGDRADPATQADSAHSRGGRSRERTHTNRNREKQHPPTAQSRANEAPKAQ